MTITPTDFDWTATRNRIFELLVPSWHAAGEEDIEDIFQDANYAAHFLRDKLVAEAKAADAAADAAAEAASEVSA